MNEEFCLIVWVRAFAEGENMENVGFAGGNFKVYIISRNERGS